MSDRRAEAFAVLDRREAAAQQTVDWSGDDILWSHRTPADRAQEARETLAYLAALRSVLERHHEKPEEFSGLCWWCLQNSPCPDETDAIDAVLGEEKTDE